MPAERTDLLKQALAVSKRATTEADYADAIAQLTACIQLKPDSAVLYSHRGKAYLALNQFQRALFDYSMTIRLEPASGRHFASRGACFKRLGRVAEALRDYSDAIRFEKDNAAGFYFERGLVQYEEGVFESAIGDFSSALERKFPEAVRLLLLRGVSNRKLGRLDESVADLRHAVTQDPSSAEVWDNLGLSLHELSGNSLPHAVAAFSGAIDLDSSRAKYFFHRGLSYYRLEEFEKAVVDFAKALSIDGADGHVWFSRGNSYMRQKKYSEALKDFDEAVRRDPRNSVYHHHRGLVLESVKDIRGAIGAFETAGNYAPAKFHLAVVFHLDGQTGRALDLLADFDEQDNAEFFERRGLILLDLDRHKEALRDFDKALEIGDSERRPHLLLSRGRTLDKMKEYGQALGDFDAALACATEAKLRAEIFWERGKTKVKENELNGAISDFTRALDENEHVEDFYLHRAQAYIALGLYELAEADLEKSGNSEFLYKRGLVRYALKKYALAVKDFDRALELSVRPSCLADLLYHLGVCLANCDQPIPAVEALNRAIERDAHTRPHFYHERAKSLQEIGKHKEALEDLSRVISWQPRNARAYFRRAFSYKALKNFEEAADDFETAKHLDNKEDPRLSVNYRKLADVALVSLGPCGFEDTYFDENNNNKFLSCVRITAV